MPLHKIEMSPEIVARVKRRRGGKLHAYTSLDPAKTALVVIDMQNVWVKDFAGCSGQKLPAVLSMKLGKSNEA